MIHSWHAAAWRQLTNHWQTLSHAYLLLGKENTGKTAFAHHFAQTLLCEKNTATYEPCGQCPSCHLFTQGTHPDFYTLTPDITETTEGTGSRKLLQIKIDAVRAILPPLTQTSVRGGRRVVLISPAETLNVQAANALLKILEEPPQAVVFILVSHNRDRVLPTIKSRCRSLVLPAPTAEQALQYWQDTHPDMSQEQAQALLAFHSHAPLFAMQPEQDALREQLLDVLAQPRLLAILDWAAECDKQKYPLAWLLDCMHKWLIDLSLISQTMPPLYYPQRAGSLHTLANKTNPATLFALIAKVNRLHPYGYHSLNVKMQAEDVLCEYLSAVSKKTR